MLASTQQNRREVFMPHHAAFRLAGRAGAAALVMLLLALSAWPARAEPRPCGEDAPCRAGEGEYYLAFPDDWDGESPLPAVLYFHSHRSSGLSGIRSAALRQEFSDHGYLIIAPNGELRANGVRGWAARPATGGGRDDLAFIDAVMSDAAARVPLDRSRVLVTGFSSGGSMVWLVACYEGASFAGYVSIAGALRRPVPDGACPGGPVRMLHFHGFADTTVPIEGRGIRDWHQGDVFESMSILRQTNDCRSDPDRIVSEQNYGCRIWSGCASGRGVELCLHAGGHMLPDGWAGRARNWFESGIGGS
jgi:polyhydroxybutyrate depolymerase